MAVCVEEVDPFFVQTAHTFGCVFGNSRSVEEACAYCNVTSVLRFAVTKQIHILDFVETKREKSPEQRSTHFGLAPCMQVSGQLAHIVAPLDVGIREIPPVGMLP